MFQLQANYLVPETDYPCVIYFVIFPCHNRLMKENWGKIIQ